MYRCHFTRNGHIFAGENLSVQTLGEAIAEAENLLAAQIDPDRADGFEIWEEATLLYTSPRAT